MKTFNSLKMFATLFMAFFLGSSFTSDLNAQSEENYQNTYLEAYNKQLSEEMVGNGIESMHVSMDGSLIVFNVLLDEEKITPEAFETIIDYAKECAEKGTISLTEEEYAFIDLLEMGDISYKYVIKGKRSGKTVVRRLSSTEVMYMSKMFESNPDEEFANMSIEEIVNMLNRVIATEDPNMSCVLQGKYVVMVIQCTQREYDDIKSVMGDDPIMYKNLMTQIFVNSLDADGASVLDTIKSRGYGFAISLNSGNNKPILLELDI